MHAYDIELMICLIKAQATSAYNTNMALYIMQLKTNIPQHQ